MSAEPARSAMTPLPSRDVYSPREIALAAGAPYDRAVAALGHPGALVPFVEAIAIGRALLDRMPIGERGVSRQPLFTAVTARTARPRERLVPLAVSSTLHVTAIAAALFIATLGLAPTSALVTAIDPAHDLERLVFLDIPGPGGGGGGGGLLQPPPPPKALREGHDTVSSPLPVREPPAPAPAPPPRPKALEAEPLPAVMAPVVAAPADTHDRLGRLEETTADMESHGPGRDGGVGAGAGTGLGDGAGPGLGAGSNGGTGGGPYRPGSGIQPPRLLREVKADYTEEARQRNLAGEVVLEIVVRRDGTVGDVRVVKGLAGGLSEQAVAAVQQWRFAPARRLNEPVDVVVEVGVEFKLR